MRYSYFLTYFFILSLFLSLPAVSFAVEFRFDGTTEAVGVGAIVQFDLSIDTQGEYINAVEGIVRVSSNVKLRSVNSANSMVKLWIESPEIVGNKIPFSGIIPGGIRGIMSPYWEGYKNGTVFTVTVETIESGVGIVTIDNAVALLHDGKGTRADSLVESVSFIIRDEQHIQFIVEDLQEEDSVPPEIFAPIITRNKSLFDNKYFIVFTALDNGSGINFYQVREGDEDLRAASSPYVLKDQNLVSDISVVAFDGAGNKREILLAAINKSVDKGVFSNKVQWLIIIVCVLLILLAIFRFREKEKEKVG